jgi:adenylosuccinate synthase
MSHAKIIIDLGFGDAGKGSVVDYLARIDASDLVVRFNGGAQAAHNVVTEKEHHTFRQFGSGVFSRARTLYSRHALFDPIMFLDEARLLEQKGVVNVTKLFFIEEDCVITTVFQQAMNRVRELSRKDGRHGSCGLGIGETASDMEEYPDSVLYVKDLVDANITHAKLEALREIKFAEAQNIAKNIHSAQMENEFAILGDPQYSRAATDAYRNISAYVNVVSHQEAVAMLRTANVPIFEGAQGILLDQDYGFYPYITHSDVTPKNAIALCEEAGITHEVTGLMRAYAVRHGPGPMPT